MSQLRTQVVAVVGVTTVALTACGSASSNVSATSTPESTASQPTPTGSPTLDPTAGWTKLSSVSGSLSLRYDPSWTAAACDPGTNYAWGTYNGPSTVIFMDAVSGGSTQCPVEEESPQILIQSTPLSTTPQATPGVGGCGADPPTTTTVTVGGVVGEREFIVYGTYAGCIGTPIIHEVRYTFTTSGRLYTLNYAYRQGDAEDLTSEFDLMVQNTVSFQAS